MAFDRKWALATVQIAIEQLRKECDASGRLELFQALKARLVVGNDKTLPYAELSPGWGKAKRRSESMPAVSGSDSTNCSTKP